MKLDAFSRHIWSTRYRGRGPEGPDARVEDTWSRVALALAGPERDRSKWARCFYESLEGFAFVPGGRVLAGAGARGEVTLVNCFVGGALGGSIHGAFTRLEETHRTLCYGGGVGIDFSPAMPSGVHDSRQAVPAPGPVGLMRLWDAMCHHLLSASPRRGAMMATLRCDHPDIEAFVDAKRDDRALRRFNLSVLVTDAFMGAVARGADWPLVFPADRIRAGSGGTVRRRWSGGAGPVRCRVLRTVPARSLWRRIVNASYDCAEPGVLFVDRINRTNNLRYRERISATNPCGELPLPANGACVLGSLNLTRFVRDAFARQASLDLDTLSSAVRVAVRMLDNALDVSEYPLQAQACEARATRRVGLGVTGLADALMMLGVRYDAEAGRDVAATAMRRICHTAYRASVELAREKGAFPAFERDRYLEAPLVRRLPAEIRDGIAGQGIRNSHLVAIAPAGTISLLAGNVSSGIEPVFALHQIRHLRDDRGRLRTYELVDPAWQRYSASHRKSGCPRWCRTAHQIRPTGHLRMQAAVSPYVDNAVSKTINLPSQASRREVGSIYLKAYELGLKGCTIFRPSASTGAVIEENACWRKHAGPVATDTGGDRKRGGIIPSTDTRPPD